MRCKKLPKGLLPGLGLLTSAFPFLLNARRSAVRKSLVGGLHRITSCQTMLAIPSARHLRSFARFARRCVAEPDARRGRLRGSRSGTWCCRGTRTVRTGWWRPRSWRRCSSARGWCGSCGSAGGRSGRRRSTRSSGTGTDGWRRTNCGSGTGCGAKTGRAWRSRASATPAPGTACTTSASPTPHLLRRRRGVGLQRLGA